MKIEKKLKRKKKSNSNETVKSRNLKWPQNLFLLPYDKCKYDKWECQSEFMKQLVIK